MSLKQALEKLKVIREYDVKDDNGETLLTLPYRICNYKESLSFSYLQRFLLKFTETTGLEDKVVVDKDISDYEDGIIRLLSSCVYYPDDKAKLLTEVDARELYLVLAPKQTQELINAILGNPQAEQKS